MLRQYNWLSGVSCVSATDCKAVGEYRNAHNDSLSLALKWNGSVWSMQDTPEPFGVAGYYPLSAVSCTAGMACTAVGTRGTETISSP
jgi:hypothetical protein